MSGAHTKAPWQAMPMEGEVVNPRTDETIAAVNFDHCDDARLMADTYLIAAAPELLEACEAAMMVLPCLEVRNWPPGWALKDDALAKLRAVLAKARGGK